MKKQIVFTVCLFLIGLLFMYASFSKYLAFHTFAHDMHNQPFPSWLSTAIVVFLPPLEMLIVVSLIFERTRKAGLYASLALMSVFTLYTVSILLHFFSRTPCGCGGVIRLLTWKQHLILNVFFMLISWLSIRLYSRLHSNNTATTVYNPI